MKDFPSTQRLNEEKTIKKKKNLKTLRDFSYTSNKKQDLTYPIFRRALVNCVCDPEEFETYWRILLLADGSSMQNFALLELGTKTFYHGKQLCP